MSHWYEPLRSIVSRGSQAKRPGSLAGLHEARKEHLAQFFTPDAICQFIDRLLAPQIQAAGDDGLLSVLDTSVGSARLFQSFVPGQVHLGGCDIDGRAISEVQRVCEEAGFSCAFEHAGLEEVRLSNWSLALLNPPFSIHLDSPLIEPLPCTSYGKFGPHSSAQSDYYAVSTALEAASAVVAILPRRVATDIWARPDVVDLQALTGQDPKTGEPVCRSRLAACFHLPPGSFKEEGTDVAVSLLVFGTGLRPRPDIVHLSTLTDIPTLPRLHIQRTTRQPVIQLKLIEDEKPSITIPVTGDPTVRVAHDGRKVRLGFNCGFTKARVMNAILREPISSTLDHRLPKDYRFAGQGLLDLQIHLLQENPEASLNSLLDLIQKQQATPIVHPGLWPYFRKLQRRYRMASAPFGHTVWRQAAARATIQAKARKTILLDPKSWSGPVIKAGQVVSFVPTTDDHFEATIAGKTLRLNFEMLDANYDEITGLGNSGWVEVHPSRARLNTAAATQLRRKIATSPVAGFLTWSFQVDDLIEFLLSPRGAVCAWSMGLGKSRLALALVYLSGVKRALITTEAHLVPEFVEKLEELHLPASDWQVIDSPSGLESLRRINIISNERLRMPLPGQDRVTYAHKLRRRIAMAISDEGEFLSNPRSAQSRALHRVSARKRFVLTGTPIPNYPRDLLPIVCYAAGEATAAQPWGYHGPYLEPRLAISCDFADRGITKFKDTFCETQWCTNEFADTLREGAKREVPKIANLGAYRSFIAPHIKRRVPDEPDCAAHLNIPKASTVVHEVEFQDDHLGHYLQVADEFAHWFDSVQDKKNSLLTILLRFQAVIRACNFPQDPSKHVQARFHGLTSKQHFLLKRMKELAQAGEKTLVYFHSPGLAHLMARHLYQETGIDAVVLTGESPAGVRHKLLRERFKLGDCPTVIATYGVTQAGHNIPQATRVVLGTRDWTAKVERQSIARALRPETRHPVVAEYVHIRGSSDDYQAQMVAWKGNTIDAGLDWATPEFEGKEFLHLDTLLGRFLTDLGELRGLKSHELRAQLKVAA
jgi:hypothetical protein